MTYTIRTTSLTVLPEKETIFSEQATTVSIVDESGEYVEVSQSGHISLGKIAINPEEWIALREAIDILIDQCRPLKEIEAEDDHK